MCYEEALRLFLLRSLQTCEYQLGCLSLRPRILRAKGQDSEFRVRYGHPEFLYRLEIHGSVSHGSYAFLVINNLLLDNSHVHWRPIACPSLQAIVIELSIFRPLAFLLRSELNSEILIVILLSKHHFNKLYNLK